MSEYEGAPRALPPGRGHMIGRRLALAMCSLLVLLGLGLEAGRVFFGRNLHTIVPGMLYRGAQPSAAELEDLVARFHIRTVVNLRGSCDPFAWYRGESLATQKLHLAQEDICFSSGRLPPGPEVRRLVEVLENADYPLFLHCRRGADRTGLASALYLLLKTDATPDQARRQLSVRYGHFAVGRTGSLDEFFDLYAAWLGQQQREHTRELFRHWLLYEYNARGLAYGIDHFAATAPLRVGRPAGFHVRVRNTGSKVWRLRPTVNAGVKLGYRVRDDQDHVVTEGFCGLFDATVSPAETVDLNVPVPSWPRPGKYGILLDMVDADSVWFFQIGSDPFEEELDVRE
jgi:hypothetical protein